MPRLDSYPALRVPSMSLEYDGQVREIDPKTVAQIMRIALNNSTGYVSAVEQAVANEGFLQAQEDAGHRLLIETGGDIFLLTRAPA
jgi:hypothetical protein